MAKFEGKKPPGVYDAEEKRFKKKHKTNPLGQYFCQKCNKPMIFLKWDFTMVRQCNCDG